MHSVEQQGWAFILGVGFQGQKRVHDYIKVTIVYICVWSIVLRWLTVAAWPIDMVDLWRSASSLKKPFSGPLGIIRNIVYVLPVDVGFLE
jgi:hypothetical protein